MFLSGLLTGKNICLIEWSWEVFSHQFFFEEFIKVEFTSSSTLLGLNFSLWEVLKLLIQSVYLLELFQLYISS